MSMPIKIHVMIQNEKCLFQSILNSLNVFDKEMFQAILFDDDDNGREEAECNVCCESVSE